MATFQGSGLVFAPFQGSGRAFLPGPICHDWPSIRPRTPGRLAMPTNAPLNRKLRMGLVGGGQGAFIGRVHATDAVLDNRAALVAGALSSDAAKAKASASDYDIPSDRAYGSYKEMAEAEATRPDKIDCVSVPTPNHPHFKIAKTSA